MTLQREVLGDELMDSGAIHNVVQTNLYRLTDPMIDFILRHRWEVGVSLDVAEGIRVTVNGTVREEQSANGVNAQTYCLVKSA